MNLVDCFVTKVLDEPLLLNSYGKDFWTIKVEYDCYGSIQNTTLFFKTKKEVEEVKEGYKFLG